jgi:four helix bundle protein
MGRPDFEELEVYKLAESLANEIWKIVKKWDYFTKDTMGQQIVRSADSVCANIAEGRGRYNDQDNRSAFCKNCERLFVRNSKVVKISLC